MRTILTAATLCSLMAASTVAMAQSDGNMDKLQDFKSTGKMNSIPNIPQDPKNAAEIEKTLSRIKLPAGFHISLYAQVPDARMLAVGPQGVVTFVSTRKNKVYAITDRSRSGHATEVKEFAPTVDFKNPNGICFSKDGFLYVAEQNRVLQFPAAEFFYESPDVAVSPIVKQGDLIPASEESFNHSARACVIGPDNKLYVTIGQPYNVYAPDKYEDYYKAGLGSIMRMNQDGTEREIFAHGLRNSVGIDFAKDKTVWFTDNQVDGMGDDIPPGEINHATKIGQNFGFPWYGGGHTRTDEYKDQTPPAGVVFPVVEYVAHAADLGMSFYTGKMFPDKYKGGIFDAEHGSWNRTTPIGARIMFTPVKDDGSVGETEVFAEGWLTPNGEYMGRPVDVQQLQDGSLLVSDDYAGAIYRISYSK